MAYIKQQDISSTIETPAKQLKLVGFAEEYNRCKKTRFFNWLEYERLARELAARMDFLSAVYHICKDVATEELAQILQHP